MTLVEQKNVDVIRAIIDKLPPPTEQDITETWNIVSSPDIITNGIGYKYEISLEWTGYTLPALAADSATDEEKTQAHLARDKERDRIASLIQRRICLLHENTKYYYNDVSTKRKIIVAGKDTYYLLANATFERSNLINLQYLTLHTLDDSIPSNIPLSL